MPFGRSAQQRAGDKFSGRIEAALERLATRVARSKKRLDREQVNRQIGRILQQNQRAARRFKVRLAEDGSSAGFRLEVEVCASFDDWAALLKRFALPRVGEVIEERQERDLDQAAALKAETEQALANYEQALIEARGRTHAVLTDMGDKLAAEIDKKGAKFDAQIARKLADADARITQAKSNALADVGGIAADAAVATVAKLIGAQVSNDEVRKALVKHAAE